MPDMKKHIISIISLGIVLALNIYFRTFPINFPQLKTQAQDIVEQKIYKEAIQQIDKNFPEYSGLAKDRLIKTLVSDLRRQKKAEIKNLTQEEYRKLKDRYQDDHGQTYLMELDCWHWARYVDNVLRLGHPGDAVVNGKQWDNSMLAPLGYDLHWNYFLFYFSAFLYRVFSLFKFVPLFTFLFYLPLFFIAIFIITLYLFCFYQWGNLGATISCLFVGLAPIFLPRSCAGWFDMDILNLLFPLLTTWTYLKAFDAVSFKQRLFWVCFSAFWLGLFSFTWMFWWFIFLVIIIYEIFSLLNLTFVYLQYKEKILSLFKQHLFSLILFLIFSLFWIFIFSGREPLIAFYSQLKITLSLNKPLIASIWPNVYATVGEFRKINPREIINSMGSAFLFILSLFSMLWLFLHHRKYTAFRRECIGIMTFWLISMFFACLKGGVRFTMFLLIPLGMSLGGMISEIYLYLTNKKKKWLIYLFIAAVIIFSAEFLNNAYGTAKSIFPLMDDTWYKALITIKENTPSEAIINSWWDFGDWFKVVSNRRVIFDGQTQHLPQSYWMGRVLMADNEEEAMAILKMLNNGGNSTFEIIDKQLKDPFKSVLLLEKIISIKSQSETEKVLLEFLPLSTTKKITELLFARPAKAYFIVDYTMLNKIIPISYLGNWDFVKVYIAQNIDKKDKKQIIDYLTSLGVDNQKAERLYQEASLVSEQNLENWVSKPFKFFSKLVKGRKDKDTVLFDNGIIYNLKEQTVSLYSYLEAKFKIPKSLFLFENNTLKEIAYPNCDSNFAVLVLKDQEDYQAFSLDYELANSLFVRLYFLNSSSLKYFKPFRQEKDESGYIRIFEIIWE
jgi:dolichyl-diphosphooligosaccharide--protein glycosyltransferase